MEDSRYNKNAMDERKPILKKKNNEGRMVYVDSMPFFLHVRSGIAINQKSFLNEKTL